MNTTNKQNGFFFQIKIPVKDEDGRVVFIDLTESGQVFSETEKSKSTYSSQQPSLQTKSAPTSAASQDQKNTADKQNKKEPVDMFEESVDIEKIVSEAGPHNKKNIASSDHDQVHLKEEKSTFSFSRVQSDHWFDPEDEMELAKVKVPQVKKLDDSILKKEALALAKKSLKGSSDKMINRLALIIFTFWKDLKDYLRTKEALMRKKELGGLEFSEEKANQILDKAAIKKQELLSGKTSQLSNRSEKEDIFKSSSEASHSSTQSSLDINEDLQDIPKSSSDHLFTEVKPRVNTRIASDIKASDTAHKFHQDRLIGPIKELELIDLDTFRKLGKTPEDAAKRIKQKIEILSDESIEQMAKGIAAFKRSPLYKMYLKIGHIGIEKHKPIADVIKEKLAGDMTLEEFNAISDLSKNISF